MRTNAVLFLPPMPGGAGAAMIGAIDADRIAEMYDFSSSTNQIEVQRVFEVADAASAEMTLEASAGGGRDEQTTREGEEIGFTKRRVAQTNHERLRVDFRRYRWHFSTRRGDEFVRVLYSRVNFVGEVGHVSVDEETDRRFGEHASAATESERVTSYVCERPGEVTDGNGEIV